MHVIYEYLRLVVFGAGLLSGIQIPALVDQYSQRVDAHLVEARQNLSGFEQTAMRFFGGDLNKLIAHYRASQDPVFVADADSIQAIRQRVNLLTYEQQQLQQHALLRTYHVLFEGQAQLREETLQHYSYTVPLNPQALAWGLALAFLLSLLVEGCTRGTVKTAKVSVSAALGRKHRPH